MSTDYGPAIWLGNAQIGYGDWQPDNRKWIIVHGTAGDATIEAVAATFEANTARGAPSSTHYAVGEDGRIGQYVPEDATAWGNGPITGPAGVAAAGSGGAHDAWWDTANPDHNANPSTFSIEHCKSDPTNAAALTPAQKAASFALIKHLCEKWGIPKHVYGVSPYDQLQFGGVTGHFSMDPINRTNCPGSYPWAELAVYLNEGGSGMGVPAGWKDDGTTLTAPNGVSVVHGFRDHILNAPAWDPANVPLAPEAAATPADPANPQGCAGSVQYFLRSILVWQSCDDHLWETDAGKAAYLAAQASGPNDPEAGELDVSQRSALRAALSAAVSRATEAQTAVQAAYALT